MRGRPPTGTDRARQRSIYCSPAEWATISERAAAAGMSVSRFAVGCALREAEEAEGRALGEDGAEALRRTAAHLERLAGALLDGVPGTGLPLVAALALAASDGAAPPADGDGA